MSLTGFYSGSFDPVTLGHEDIIGRATRIVDRLVIGVGVHPSKTPLFTPDEKIEMLQAVTRRLAAAQIGIVTFDGLTVDAAKAAGATVIVRGVRDTTDFAYEMQMAGMNAAMAPGIETVFLTAAPGVGHIAGTLVRQIAQMGGDITKFVSTDVAARLSAKVAARRKA